MAVSASALLMCTLAHEDWDSHNLSLLGIFSTIRTDRFPSPRRDFSAYALLTGDPGERGELELVCEETATGDVREHWRGRTEIGRNGHRHLHVRISEFGVARPGTYRFVLSCNGRAIGEQAIDFELRT